MRHKVVMDNIQLPFCRWFVSYLLLYNGEEKESLDILKAMKWTPTRDIFTQFAQFQRLSLKGNSRKAHELLTPEFISSVSRDSVWPLFVAAFFVMLNEKEHALFWVEKLVSRGFINFPHLSQHDRFLTRLRGEPRYEKLLEEVKREWESLPADV